MKRTPRKPPEPRAKTKPAAPKTRAEVIEATIQDAMRPYLGVMPPEGLKTMRDILEDALTTHPVATEALDDIEKQAAEEASGTRTKPRGDA
jgi:hypothetical protein